MAASPSEEARPAQRRRPRPYQATVTGTEALTPYLLRITFEDGSSANPSGLAAFSWPGPASHLKLFLPEPGQHRVDLPPVDAEGFMVSEPGRPRPATRTFTPRRFDPATGRLELEFVLHGHGLASRWADAASPGDQVAVSQPRRTYEVLPDSRWLLLAGDESAVPAIATLLEAVDPGLHVQVLIELEAADHQVPLPPHPCLALTQLPCDPQDAPGTPLTTAITGWTPPAGPGQVWTACEAAAVRTIRRHLLGPLALPADRVLTRGYWRRGEQNHPDHDYGDEPL